MILFANTSMLEGLGSTPIEAHACRTPVVYFKDADIPDEAKKNFLFSLRIRMNSFRTYTM